ncbi:MAG: hypothetical protein HKN17_00345 [Rhodothermales bacterium]|nr:hypothetical protein [Rhodothermales bacterium]
MSSVLQNMLILGFCWLLATGGGIWLTFVKQPAEKERLEKAEQVVKMKNAELTTLSAEIGATREQAKQVKARWESRYKVVPSDLGSEEVIDFINRTTRTGFESLDVTFMQQKQHDQYNTYQFDINGRAPFSEVYNLIWSLENDRNFYRVEELALSHMDLVKQDKDTQREELVIVVTFSFKLTAFYGGMAGLSAEDDGEMQPGDASIVQVDPMSALPSIPDAVLPARSLGRNPFFPLIMEELPPNTDNLVEIEEADLVSIAGGIAVLEWDKEFYSLREGDPIYLGQIISVDPRSGRVVGRLNKGGIIDEIELELKDADLFRQAQGNVELTPSENN